jgi:4-hydroxy-2-oxoheptanedioate aldolase
MMNAFKAALAQGRLQIGLWQALANPYTAEICATAGFDWLLFDGEHAPNDVPLLLSQLQAVSAYASHPVARPPCGDAHLIKRYLDIGFTTLLVPFVETPDQAAMLVAATRYPPAGVRGVASGLVRASRWNKIDGYLQHADDAMCLLVQIESPLGLANLAAIAATPGVDGVFIGPADLSAALGHRGAPQHPQVQARIARAIREIRDCGKPAGILASDEASARRYIELGCSFVAVGTDVALLALGARALRARYEANSPG